MSAQLWRQLQQHALAAYEAYRDNDGDIWSVARFEKGNRKAHNVKGKTWVDQAHKQCAADELRDMLAKHELDIDRLSVVGPEPGQSALFLYGEDKGGAWTALCAVNGPDMPGLAGLDWQPATHSDPFHNILNPIYV